MELRNLITFIHVAELGSFTKAAEALDYSQSTVSFQIKQLEEKGKTEKSAMSEVEAEFGFPVYAVVDVYDIIEYLEEDEKNAENVQRIRNYLAVNGAKA